MSRKRIEIPLGSVFGLWTVLKKIDRKGSTYYMCVCNCENKTIREINAKNLNNGKSMSCGCSRKGKVKKKTKRNKYLIKDDYVVFYDSQDREFFVDLVDFEKVNNHTSTWYVHENGNEQYVISKVNYKQVRLHNFIMQPPKGFIVDHINGIPYDNRRSNLRIVTTDLNAKNKAIQRNNTSGESGVNQKHNGKWIARIGVDGKRIHLGVFETFEEAVKARREAEKEHFGEYARKREEDKDEESYE